MMTLDASLLKQLAKVFLPSKSARNGAEDANGATGLERHLKIGSVLLLGNTEL